MDMKRLFNTPLALQPAAAHALLAHRAMQAGHPTASMAPVDAHPSQSAGYEVFSGVALIPIHGVLMQTLGVLHPWFGMSGYDGIRQNILMALADPDVRAVALDIDSPGGTVSGCFDLADTMYQARGEKPIWAILNEQACSAAYALASAAEVVTVPRTGSTGSIGIIYLHVDMSQAHQDAGLNVTLLTYGARKADGHPALPLSEDARARFEAEIDQMGELFVETVARNRGLSPQAVRHTEAATFLGAAGVDAGLADAVISPDAAFRALLQQFN
jgi:capsid assembly protease